MHAALNAGDNERLRHLAHALRGTGATLGAGRLSAHAAALEFALNGVAGEAFAEGKDRLTKGEVLLVYSDGVTEALDGEHRCYGEGRLIDLFAGRSRDDAQALVETVVADVEQFADGAEQSDDITLLAVVFRGGFEVRRLGAV